MSKIEKIDEYLFDPNPQYHRSQSKMETIVNSMYIHLRTVEKDSKNETYKNNFKNAIADCVEYAVKNRNEKDILKNIFNVLIEIYMEIIEIKVDQDIIDILVMSRMIIRDQL
jgi:hypothetical protein